MSSGVIRVKFGSEIVDPNAMQFERRIRIFQSFNLKLSIVEIQRL